MERRRDALLLGAGAPLRALRVALGPLEVRQLGACVGEIRLEIGDLAVRGFWSNYAQFMGIEPPGGVR